jgi:hypothetical protein
MERARIVFVAALMMVLAKEAFPSTKIASLGSEKFYAVSGVGTLFTRVSIPGFTDIQEGTNGIALADLNRDGWVDIIATYTPPMGSTRSSQDKLRVFINQGNLQFKEHAIKITNQRFAPSESWRRPQIPNLVDFNRDGFLDLYITRSAADERRPVHTRQADHRQFPAR